jgi:hypothetical protein
VIGAMADYLVELGEVLKRCELMKRELEIMQSKILDLTIVVEADAKKKFEAVFEKRERALNEHKRAYERQLGNMLTNTADIDEGVCMGYDEIDH